MRRVVLILFLAEFLAASSLVAMNQMMSGGYSFMPDGPVWYQVAKPVLRSCIGAMGCAMVLMAVAGFLCLKERL